MLKYKISKIAKATNRSYNSAKKRVEILAPVMKGRTRAEKLDNACEKILEKVARHRVVFCNVNFINLYKDIL